MSAWSTILISLEILAASVWVGSLVCLVLVSRVAHRVLDSPSRVALFRGVGQLYGVVGTACLVVAITIGLVLAWPMSGALDVVVLVLSLSLVAVTGAGMVQARRMSVRRRYALDVPQDEVAAGAVRRGAAFAGFLRGSIAILTLVIVVLSAHLLAT